MRLSKVEMRLSKVEMRSAGLPQRKIPLVQFANYCSLVKVFFALLPLVQGRSYCHNFTESATPQPLPPKKRIFLLKKSFPVNPSEELVAILNFSPWVIGHVPYVGWQFGRLLSSLLLPAKGKKGMTLCLLILFLCKEEEEEKKTLKHCLLY